MAESLSPTSPQYRPSFLDLDPHLPPEPSPMSRQDMINSPSERNHQIQGGFAVPNNFESYMSINGNGSVQMPVSKETSPDTDLTDTKGVAARPDFEHTTTLHQTSQCAQYELFRGSKKPAQSEEHRACTLQILQIWAVSGGQSLSFLSCVGDHR